METAARYSNPVINACSAEAMENIVILTPTIIPASVEDKLLAILNISSINKPDSFPTKKQIH